MVKNVKKIRIHDIKTLLTMRIEYTKTTKFI